MDPFKTSVQQGSMIEAGLETGGAKTMEPLQQYGTTVTTVITAHRGLKHLLSR